MTRRLIGLLITLALGFLTASTSRPSTGCRPCTHSEPRWTLAVSCPMG
jgi:hypothetical protein